LLCRDIEFALPLNGVDLSFQFTKDGSLVARTGTHFQHFAKWENIEQLGLKGKGWEMV